MQKKIGDRTYELTPPGGLQSFILQQRIIPVATDLANVFLNIFGTDDVKELGSKDVLSVLPQAMGPLRKVFANMPPGELEVLTRTMLADLKMNKMPMFGGPAGDAFEGFMQGRTLEIWELLWWALEVWYPDFFARGRQFLAPKSVGSPSPASTTSDPPGPATA